MAQSATARIIISTVGDRAFPMSGSRLWNSLSHVITSAPTLAVYWNQLKTFLFFSFVHALTDAYTPFSGLAVFTQKVKVECALLQLECRRGAVSP